MEPMLEVANLKKSYPNFHLQDVSFVIPTDCITGFIGINGAGKTTTIRTILGLVKKDSGTIKLFGKELKDNDKELKNRIGFVLDSGGFYDELTIAEMKSIIAGAYTNWREKTFLDYLDRFSLNPKQKINTLSKGMRMKYALSLALSHDADLLIMDEPTSGLDPLVRNNLLEILKEYMNTGGKSIFFSTHITSDLDKSADLLLLINKGSILFQKDKDLLLDTHRLVKGDARELNETNRKLFLSITETGYGFSGITDKAQEVTRSMSGILMEKANLEDIMLSYIGTDKSFKNLSGGSHYDNSAC